MTKSLLALCGLLAASALTAHLMAEAPLPPAMAFALSIGTALLLGFGAYWLLVRPKLRALEQLRIALSELGAGKCAARLGPEGERALGDLAVRFDALGATLAAEQRDNLKRKLLEAIGGWAPVAILLYSDAGCIVYANDEARQLFFEGKNPEGGNFLRMLQEAPEPLRACLLSDTDALFTLESGTDRETYNLCKRYLDVEGEPYTLVTVKHMTREFGRREAEVYKRVIRVISHEFNNSLAPIISLIHSAKLIAKKPEHLPKLEKVLETIEERATHLNTFLEGYANFARLPRPRPQIVSWSPFLDGIRALWPSVKVGPAPERPGYFDAAQMQQVIINLLKNADEAKKDKTDVQLTVEATYDGGTLFRVADRGRGMSADVMKNAMEPFFSTKERSSGVGLALCREIVEAHNGRLKIETGDVGGCIVSCWVPGQGANAPVRTGRLTLSRG